MSADPPIYFRSLQLENVRCFGQRQELKFTDDDGKPFQWILILGDNGVGKTTLLQCLAWMRPVPRIKEQGVLEAIDPALNDEENHVLRSLLRRTGDEVKAILAAEFSVGQKLGQSVGDPACESIGTSITLRGTPGRLEDTELVKPCPERVKHTPSLDLPIFAYGAARRPGTFLRDEEDLSDPLASLFSESAELYDAEDILLKLHHRAKSEEEQDQAMLLQVKQVLAAVLPDVKDEEIYIHAPSVLGRGSEASGVQFETPYGRVPITGLSLGYQTTLTWIVDLALRLYQHYPDSTDPLSEPGIVLVDEIDLHLHPRWQRHMMADITQSFPAVQFVATAHSPLIVQAAENAKLVLLREKEGQVVIEDTHEIVNAWRVDQILASDLFGIPTRSEHFEELRMKRNALLGKPNRTEDEEASLKLVEKELDGLPTAEDAKDRAAMNLIREIAKELSETGSDGS